MVHVGDLKVEEVKEGRVVDGERGRHLFIFYFLFFGTLSIFFYQDLVHTGQGRIRALRHCAAREWHRTKRHDDRRMRARGRAASPTRARNPRCDLSPPPHRGDPTGNTIVGGFYSEVKIIRKSRCETSSRRYSAY